MVLGTVIGGRVGGESTPVDLCLCLYDKNIWTDYLSEHFRNDSQCSPVDNRKRLSFSRQSGVLGFKEIEITPRADSHNYRS